MGDDVGVRGRGTIGKDQRAGEFGARGGGGDAGEVIDMDPVEDMARLVDALRRARTQPVEGRTPGPVNPGDPEPRKGQVARIGPVLQASSAASRARPRAPVGLTGLSSSIDAPRASP
jgi:hypothetical protein